MKGRAKKFLDLRALDDALALWRDRLSALKPTEAERIRVEDSLGRVTAGPVAANISSPFYHSSAMDGYAVRFKDTFGASEVSPKLIKLGDGARYVDTGDPMPEGFDSVIMVEDAHVTGDYIEIIEAATPWQNVRTIGEDIVVTELILPEGKRIGPADIGAMLAGGHTEVEVRRKPRVAVIPTGTELVEPGGALKVGDIIEYNSRMLSAMLVEWGAEPVRMAIVPDDPARLASALDEALARADMAVINAGASAGSEDYTERIISGAGELLLHGLAIKPGKPLMLGWARGRPVIGVPGYPVSAYITFTLFGRPFVMRALGLDEGRPETVTAKLSRQISSQLGQEEFIRLKLGKVGDRLIATPLGRGAGTLMSLVRADGMMRVPRMSEGPGAGAEVEVELIRPRDEIENTVVIIGSHDNSLDLLANSLRRKFPRYSLSSAHVGSMGGLIALKRGEAHAAPTHLLDEETGEYNVPYIKRLLPERGVVLVNLVYREQGLMVPKGNPKGIKGFEDLARKDVTYINRQRGSGTRLLLDKYLKELSIDPSGINGYDREEYTHMSVASAVLTGVADAGLGVLSSARALGLDFIPVARERYDIAVASEFYGTELIGALMHIVREDGEFRRAVEALGGYDTSDMGRVMYTGGAE